MIRHYIFYFTICNWFDLIVVLLRVSDNMNTILKSTYPHDTCTGILCISHMNHKRKAIPLQAWTGPEGSRRFSLPDFMTIGT